MKDGMNKERLVGSRHQMQNDRVSELSLFRQIFYKSLPSAKGRIISRTKIDKNLAIYNA